MAEPVRRHQWDGPGDIINCGTYQRGDVERVCGRISVGLQLKSSLVAATENLVWSTTNPKHWPVSRVLFKRNNGRQLGCGGHCWHQADDCQNQIFVGDMLRNKFSNTPIIKDRKVL